MMLGRHGGRWAARILRQVHRSQGRLGDSKHVTPERVNDVNTEVWTCVLGGRGICCLTVPPVQNSTTGVRMQSSGNTIDRVEAVQHNDVDTQRVPNSSGPAPRDITHEHDHVSHQQDYVGDNSQDSQDSREFKLAVKSFENSVFSQGRKKSLVSEGREVTPVVEGEITDLDHLPPKRVVKPVFNLAALVNKSETLANLLKLGVDLSVVEKDRDAANLLIHLDFEKDVQPVLFFLHDVGIDGPDLGPILTRYPMILQHSLEDLQNHVQYLKSKTFTADSVARIIAKAPAMFSMPVENIDSSLGVYQRVFKLTGDEVRDVVTRLPKLITWDSSKVKDVRFYMKEFLGFSNTEIKKIFLSTPKVLLSDRHQLGKRFDFLYNEMKLTHNALVTWPQVFRTRLHLIRQRHLYLQNVGRAQYDPQKENYVSLRSLVSGKDRDFCFHISKSSVAHFNDFLKTM